MIRNESPLYEIHQKLFQNETILLEKTYETQSYIEIDRKTSCPPNLPLNIFIDLNDCYKDHKMVKEFFNNFLSGKELLKKMIQFFLK
jgi:hypothetical protein